MPSVSSQQSDPASSGLFSPAEKLISRHSTRHRLVAVILNAILLTGIGSAESWAQTPKVPSPDKSTLITTLRAACELLEKNELAAAATHFVLPPNFKPEMLEGLISKREISVAGIDRLEAEATFGTAVELFGAERANYFAERAKVDVGKCYGFHFNTPESTAEVIAVWDGSRFKLVRLDDVGQLSPVAKARLSGKTDSTAGDEEAEKQAIAATLPSLEAEVNANPKDVTAKSRYAMALYQVGNLPAAWNQLREAQALDPQRAGINKGLGALLRAFEGAGLFNVGVPSETIESLLGKPDKVVDLGRANRWVYAFFGVDFEEGRLHEVIDLRGATEALFLPTEILSIDLDGRGWTCGVRSKSAGRSTALYYIPGESVAQWTEQIEINRLLDLAKAGTMTEIKDKLVAELKVRHADLEQQVIAEDEQSMIIAFVFPAQPGFEKRHQLLRIMKGPQDLHRISYTVKLDNPTIEMQKKWLSIFEAAKLLPVKKD